MVSNLDVLIQLEWVEEQSLRNLGAVELTTPRMSIEIKAITEALALLLPLK